MVASYLVRVSFSEQMESFLLSPKALRGWKPGVRKVGWLCKLSSLSRLINLPGAAVCRQGRRLKEGAEGRRKQF